MSNKVKIITAVVLIVTAVLILLFGKNNNQQSNYSLYKSWTHSYEDDPKIEKLADGRTDVKYKVFLPSDSKTFPPSRFRQVFDFNKDGSCSWLYLHPADAHYMKDGKCDYDFENSLIIIFDESGKAVHKFKIMELTDSELKIYN